jgi:LAO/AO transport system kinase
MSVAVDAPLQALVARVRAGEQHAGARLMRAIDDRQARAFEALRLLYPHTGRAHIIGITGNPGSGKSSLVSELIRHYRGEGKRVGVVAVDPSSPFSGGAILGDRIRMSEHATDPQVFIRSLATRGHLGGLSRSTNDVVTVLDGMGYEVVLVETVGVGQDEVEVMRVAATCVVVLCPGMGDEIQAIKAGILEIADVFVVNKADREGADRAVKDLRSMAELVPTERPWKPPIVRTIAPQSQGIAELAAAIQDHQAHLPGSHEMRERRRRREAHVLESLIADRLKARVAHALGEAQARDALYDRLTARETDPYSEADRILAELLDGGEES